jgi:Flp pilus assembly pilin Flp
MKMGNLTNLARALNSDSRGIAVAEYGMIVSVLTGLVVGLMTLGGNVSESIQSVGLLLRSVLPGHY